MKTVWLVMKSEPDGKGGADSTPVKAFWNELDAIQFADNSNPYDYEFDDIASFDVVEITVEQQLPKDCKG